jgi:hypothetical protein
MFLFQSLLFLCKYFCLYFRMYISLLSLFFFYIYLIPSRPGSKTFSEAVSSMWAIKASCTRFFTKLNLSGPLTHPLAVSSVFYNTLTFDFYFRGCFYDSHAGNWGLVSGSYLKTQASL